MARIGCLSFLICFLLSLTFGNGDTLALKSRIVNGEIVQISKHPYVVSIHRRSCKECDFEHYCGGAIYNENYILTAANCVRNVGAHDLLIVAGSSYRTNFLKDGGIVFPAAQIVTHPDENIDLAIIRLALKISLNTSLSIKEATLATATPTSGTLATIAGWGRVSETGEYSEVLREALIPILDTEQCHTLNDWNKINDNEICAGYTNVGSKACQGDAGGPLTVNGQMVGVTSWSMGCASQGKPGVYTNVVKLNNWILSQTLGVRVAFL